MIHLDTQVAVWLYIERFDRLPRRATRMLEHESAAISPMVELELGFLHDVGRLLDPPDSVLGSLQPALGLQVSAAPFPAVAREAARLTWTRDPFDRIIAAQSLVDDATLLTADESILEHLPNARWE